MKAYTPTPCAAQPSRCAWRFPVRCWQRPRTGRRRTAGARNTTRSYAGYKGHSGRDWDSDYGVESGACDRVKVGQVLGGVAGGVIGGVVGSEVSKGSPDTNSNVAIVVGTGLARHRLGDRASHGQDRSLLRRPVARAGRGRAQRQVDQPEHARTYQLTPLGNVSGVEGCRSFRLVAHGNFGLSEGRTVACPDADGVWTLADDTRVSRR